MFTEILNKLDEETALHNLTPRTCLEYRATVNRFLKVIQKAPSLLTDDDARAYLLAKLLRRQSKLAEKKAAVAITPGANFDFS